MSSTRRRLRCPTADLVVDAAFGTGFRGEWSAPDTAAGPRRRHPERRRQPHRCGRWPRADRRLHGDVRSLKPRLLFPPGRELAGSVELVDIGLAVSGAATHLVEQADVRMDAAPAGRRAQVEGRALGRAGSPEMLGAAISSPAPRNGRAHGPALVARRDRRSGRSDRDRAAPAAVRLGRPRARGGGALRRDGRRTWLGRSEPVVGQVREPKRARRRSHSSSTATGCSHSPAARRCLQGGLSQRSSRRTTANTPTSRARPPGRDRLAAARELAAAWSSVVLLKGSDDRRRRSRRPGSGGHGRRLAPGHRRNW